MRLSEGCPTRASHTATVNNASAFVYALSRSSGKKTRVLLESDFKAKVHFEGIWITDQLAAVAQVVVVLTQPVFPWGIENVEVQGVLDSPSFVGHV